MKSLTIRGLVLAGAMLTWGCGSPPSSTPPVDGEAWTSLFNGVDLTGWDTYLGPRKPDAPAGEASLGLNNDPEKVFGVVQVDGGPAIRISGEIGGGISTVNEYENYHLKLEFKWGERTWWPSRTKRDSGVLYHAVGPHGADYRFWMRSQEFQIQEGDCGDYWGVAGGVFDVKARPQESGDPVFDRKGELLTFSADSEIGRHCVKSPDAEKPNGEWNLIELYCVGGDAVHVVNSKVVMILQNSRQSTEGGEIPLTKGKIQIQSEGAEVYYRNLELKPIDEIPAELLGS